jgi:nitrate/TMAO reductase-like tetraheme cytochrome c subunit
MRNDNKKPEWQYIKEPESWRCSNCHAFALFAYTVCPSCNAVMRNPEATSEAAGKVATDCYNRIITGDFFKGGTK